MPDSRNKRQHYIAQSYLRAWLDPESTCSKEMEPYVWLLDKNGGNPIRKAPRNIFSEQDTYTVHLPDGTRDLGLEHDLAELEGKFARIRRTKFEQHQWPTEDEWALVCAFAVASSARTVAFRTRHEAYLRHLGQTIDHVLLDRPASSPPFTLEINYPLPSARKGEIFGVRSITPQEFKEFEANPFLYHFEIAFLSTLPHVVRMQRMVLETSEQMGYITSDSPLIGTSPERGFSPAIDDVDIEFWLPISPRQCLVFTTRPNKTGVGTYRRVSEHAVGWVNDAIRAAAPTTIVSNHRVVRTLDPTVKRIVEAGMRQT